MFSLGDVTRLQELVDERSIHKIENFLIELKDQDSSFGWEINLFYEGRLQPIHFAGGVAEGRLLILAAKSRSEVFHLYNELIYTNNNFVDSLRDIIAEQAQLAQTHIDRDNDFFDKLTELNNQLATLQRQLAKKNVALERLNQQKNYFLGMAAHDLRGPLSAIMAYSDFILSEAQDVLSDEHLQFLSIIHSSSNFMANLVSDLLDVSAIESGQLALYYEVINLTNLISELIEINTILANRKGIEIAFSCPEDALWMEVDPTKIRQVIDNLVGNAIKYSPEGETIQVNLSATDLEVTIAVKDHGPGIPSDEIEKLFQIFGRTSVRSPSGEKSTGLGLAITQRIVDGHGGKIWVESKVGEGSTFTVLLPMEREEI